MRACLACGRATTQARCPECTIDYGYRTTHWQTIRAMRLTIDRHRCQILHAGCTGRATTVHLDPKAGGDHRQATLTNTISACPSCHGTTDAPRSTGYPATVFA